MTATEPLLQVRGLRTWFPASRGWGGARGQVRAVDGVDLDVAAGETFGLVGESGCGKSTLGRSVLRLVEPTAGEVRFEGEDLRSLPARELRRRRRHATMIFQDPYASLDPRQTVAEIVGEPLDVHRLHPTRAARAARVAELLDLVGLNPSYVGRYPHQFSGGERQRIGIARALAVQPRFVVCDEPISALDVSIQAQVINLLRRLQAELSLTYLFIAHDLSVVRHISDHVGVMYLGKLVEVAPVEELFRSPRHPYTRSLLSAIPVPDPASRHHPPQPLRGELPSPIDPPSGCRFRTRCDRAEARCAQGEPGLDPAGAAHRVACFFPVDDPLPLPLPLPPSNLSRDPEPGAPIPRQVRGEGEPGGLGVRRRSDHRPGGQP